MTCKKSPPTEAIIIKSGALMPRRGHWLKRPMRRMAMWLERIGSNPKFDCQAKSVSFSSYSTYRDARNDGEHIHVHFPRFGTILENANDFRASLDWSDVEAIVRVFCEMKHPEAARLMRAKTLAAAIEDFANDRR
jgi:hypothetical protein